MFLPLIYLVVGDLRYLVSICVVEDIDAESVKDDILDLARNKDLSREEKRERLMELAKKKEEERSAATNSSGRIEKVIEKPDFPTFDPPAEAPPFLKVGVKDLHEENIHHLVMYGLKEIGEVYGPEVDLGRQKIDVLCDARKELGEIIGIEIKTDPEAFSKSTKELDRLIEFIESEKLDRLYVLAPEVEGKEIRLDIDPEATNNLIQPFKLASTSIALRGIEGTIRNSDGRKIPKVAYYKQFVNKPEKLFEEAERLGDLEQIRKNLESNEYASLGGEEPPRGGEWRDLRLQDVGILNFDARMGAVEPEIPPDGYAGKLTRRNLPYAMRRRSLREKDIVHTLWKWFREQGKYVVVEVELPGAKHIVERRVKTPRDKDGKVSMELDWDRGETLIGETYRHQKEAPRIDIVVYDSDSGRVKGIEVKEKVSSLSRLKEQLTIYRDSGDLDELYLTIPESKRPNVEGFLSESLPSIGLITVDEEGRVDLEKSAGRGE